MTSPTTFHALNFKSEINSIDELYYFIDSQHINRFEQNIIKYESLPYDDYVFFKKNL